MVQTLPDVAERFDAARALAGIAGKHQADLRRWLRFYLDFCDKYQHHAALRSSFLAFSDELHGP